MPNDTALSSFSINAKTRSFQLDPEGKGVCTFTITNNGKTALEGRVRLTPTGQNPAVAEWLTIAEPTEQAYKPNEEHSYTVAITVPPDAPGGTYLFRAEAYSVANPNDDYVGGPEFSFTVVREGPGVKKPFPLWIPFTGLALVVAIAALVAVLMMSGGPAVQRTTVPELVGIDEEKAKQLLNEAKLGVGNIERLPTDKAAEGVVTGQGIPAGEEVEAHVQVSLQVAMKPETPLAAVPSLVGKPLAEARRLIAEAKLKPGLIGEKDEGAGAPETVLEQLPAAGASVGQGSEVSLMVKAKPAPVGPATPSWEGVLRVRQTWHGDIDGAKECDAATRKDADFWFQAVTATERYLTAENGAAFGFPSEPTLASCRDAIAVAPVTRIALASLKPDKLIAVRTNLGRFALVSLASPVGASPATLELRYQRFLMRVLPTRPLLDLKEIQQLKVQPAKPVSLAPAEPVRPAATTTVVQPAVVKPAAEPAPAPRFEKRELIR